MKTLLNAKGEELKPQAPEPKDLYIFGAGGGAIETLEDSLYVLGKGVFIPRYLILVEDNPTKDKLIVFGEEFPIVAMADLPKGEIYGHISAFTPKYKEKLDKLKDVKWITAVSYMAKLPDYKPVGFNLRAYSFIGRTAEIGRHVKVNYHSIVTHNCEIGDYSFISHNVAMSAKVKIGKRCTIYENATILPGVTIGDDTVIGAHSLVTKDIPSNVLAYGSPAKVVKDND